MKAGRRFLFLAIFAGLAHSGSGLAQAASVLLSWAPNSDQVAGYKIHQGTAAGIYTLHFNAGLGTSYTASGLQPGAGYYFAATSYNSLGVESVYSAPIFYQVPTPTPTSSPSPAPQVRATPCSGVGRPLAGRSALLGCARSPCGS